MGKGIVRNTPRGSKPGTVELVSPEGGEKFEVKSGTKLNYNQEGYSEGDTVNCTVDSKTDCTIISKE